MTSLKPNLSILFTVWISLPHLNMLLLQYFYCLIFFNTGRLHCLLIQKTPALHHASGLLWLWDMNSPINGLEILLLWYLIFLSAQIYLSPFCCILFWLHSFSGLPGTLCQKKVNNRKTLFQKVHIEKCLSESLCWSRACGQSFFNRKYFLSCCRICLLVGEVTILMWWEDELPLRWRDSMQWDSRSTVVSWVLFIM